MESLREAFDRPFPAGRDWAVRAAARLGLDPTSEFPVRAITQGWLRLGTTADAALVDTLFVLTDDRLGFGQLQSDGADPNWADLSMVTAVDLIEGVAFPLEAIEVQFNNGLAMFVGWTAEFVDSVIVVLNEHHAARQAAEAATDEPDASTVSAAPAPAQQPGVAFAADPAAVAFTADPAAVAFAADPAAVAFTAESAIEDVDSEGGASDAADPDAADGGEFADDLGADDLGADDLGVGAVEADPAEPSDAPQPFAFEPPATVAPSAAFGVGPLIEDFAVGQLEGDDLAPAEVADRFFDVQPATPAPPSAPSSDRPLDSFLASPTAGMATGGPWDEPGLVWPAPLDGVMYLGGHPVHSRRRKRATLLLARGGLLCSSGTWKLHAPWSEIRRMDVQGADEVKFSHNQRIAPDGSALVVELQDTTHLVFEIRRFRPASLRSMLAVPLSLINLPESMHIEDQRPPQAS